MLFFLAQFYIQLSQLQTSQRRVILVHCDDVTTKRIIDVAFRLGLFDGKKIWILLDGVIGNDILSSSLINYLRLPIGMLALHQRTIPFSNFDSIFKIIEIIGDAAKSFLISSSNWTKSSSSISCWRNTNGSRVKYSQVVYR